MRKILLLLTLLVVSGAVVWIWTRRSAPPEVPFAQVKRGTLVDMLATNGKADPAEWTAVHAQKAGPVQRVLVQQGQVVVQGAPLVELESIDAVTDLAAAEARARQASAELEIRQKGGSAPELAAIESSMKEARLEAQAARREYESLERLQAKKAATAQELAVARDRLKQAEAAIEALDRKRASLVVESDIAVAEARVRDAQMTLDAARRRVEQGTIRSPISGTVYSLSVRVGTFVNPGDELARIGKLDKMRVEIYVDEPELGRVREGLPVSITWDAKPGQTWTGEVERVPTEVVTLGTRQVGTVIAVVDNANGELLPGTNVNAAIRSHVVENTLVIPKEALRHREQENGVFVLQDGHVQWRPVEIGASSVTEVQVTAGLAEGDRVALATERPLREGEPVNPVS